ncbi:cell division ATP-binding protein FtsE [Paracoccus sphaerophysae]|uniref:cell division ATP-binding protein FtsE n=1 Tax=Paracoccus sphaerophysae TaxID=690417 RepID=UPI002355E835|nr:ATP-binding cassette domain-containing protein [Paracoccus sphaerophysae]
MIEMRDVAFAYPRGGALFQGLTLSLPRGSFHFLTGPSGAGKTTFLRMCIADLLPTAGKLTLFGQDAATMGRDAIAGLRRRVGLVHQDTQFLDHLPVAENIALPMMVAGEPIDMDAIRDLLAWVQMTGQARAMPPALSGGERQRAALARAVILSPDVILADEPTGNLDWDMSLRLLQLLVELNRSGKTVLVATHDLNLIRAAKQQVSARVLRIAGGRLQTAGAEL